MSFPVEARVPVGTGSQQPVQNVPARQMPNGMHQRVAAAPAVRQLVAVQVQHQADREPPQVRQIPGSNAVVVTKAAQPSFRR